MDTAILVDELDKNALKLIDALQSKFNFTIAALMKNEESEDWSLVFGVPELRTKGSRDALAIIYQAIKENELNLSLNDILLIDDREVTFALLRTMIKTGPTISRTVFSGNYINGIKFPDSILYKVE